MCLGTHGGVSRIIHMAAGNLALAVLTLSLCMSALAIWMSRVYPVPLELRYHTLRHCSASCYMD